MNPSRCPLEVLANNNLGIWLILHGVLYRGPAYSFMNEVRMQSLVIGKALASFVNFVHLA